MKRIMIILVNAILCIYLMIGGSISVHASRLASQANQLSPGEKILYLPIAIKSSPSKAISIIVGFGHTCALTQAGGVKCWGDNIDGELGDGTTTQRLTPIDVVGLGSDVSFISTKNVHTCALAQSGGVKCWGWNNTGQLGDGTTTTKLTPVDVAGLVSGVSAISAGGGYTCALSQAGGIKCWGENNSGQLGDGTTTQRLTPVDVLGLTSGMTAISAGNMHTCALTQHGRVKCWGENNSGQMGDGTTINRLKPVDVTGLASGVTAISAGGVSTCALTHYGGVKCWGDNISGELGDGTTINRLKPVDVAGLASGVIAISSGGGSCTEYACALLQTGGVKCWGANGYGQLGDGTWTSRSTPVEVVGLASGVSAISVGFFHTCALMQAGGIKCWGANNYGELGNGTTIDSSTPDDVKGW